MAYTDAEILSAFDRCPASVNKGAATYTQYYRDVPRSLMLTKCEAEVVAMLFDGLQPVAIAARRGCSTSFVQKVLRAVRRKARVKTNVALVYRAYKQGGYLW